MQRKEILLTDLDFSVCVCLRLHTDHHSPVQHYTECFLLHADIQTLFCSIWDELIQFGPYRPSLMTERKLNCLSISPSLPSFPPSLSVSLCRFCFSSLSRWATENLLSIKPSVSCLHSLLCVCRLLPAVIFCMQRTNTVWLRLFMSLTW